MRKKESVTEMTVRLAGKKTAAKCICTTAYVNENCKAKQTQHRSIVEHTDVTEQQMAFQSRVNSWAGKKTPVMEENKAEVNFPYSHETKMGPIPVVKVNVVVIKMAQSDARWGKMPLYVAVNSEGQPLSCCGDLETLQITEPAPMSGAFNPLTEDAKYVPVAIIEVTA